MRTSVCRWLMYFACALIIVLIPGIAKAWRVCARLNTSFENVDGGEDYILDADGPYAAMYQKVLVHRLGVIYADTYLNEAGCVTFAAPYPDNYIVIFYSEVRVPRTDNTAQTNIGQITNSSSQLAVWGFGHTFTTTQKMFDLPAAWATNLIVATRQSLFRFSNGISGKLFRVKHQACPTDANNSCNDGSYSSSTATIYIHPDHNSRKYAIAHEIGHGLLAHYFNRNPWPWEASSTYAFNGGGSECEWSGAGSHMMHSMEYAAGGFLEGFAQYYATYAFNSEASTQAHFYYYKDGAGVTNVNMEAGPTGGATAYMSTECSGVLAGKGCELDWARQFWDYRTNSGTKPSNGALLSQLHAAFNYTPSWHTGVSNPASGDYDNTVNRIILALSNYDTIHGTGFATRWGSTDDLNGINYPDP